jgi:hypothetical protein
MQYVDSVSLLRAFYCVFLAVTLSCSRVSFSNIYPPPFDLMFLTFSSVPLQTSGDWPEEHAGSREGPEACQSTKPKVLLRVVRVKG